MLTVATVLAVIAAAGGLAAWRMTWLKPVWWPAEVAVSEQTEALADRVEYRIAEEAHKVRPEPEPWRVRVREEQVNAWLASRLSQWLAHSAGVEWPGALGTPRVRFVNGGVSVGLHFDDHGRRRYVVADLDPRIVDGRLTLNLTGVSLGRLRVPGGSIRALIDGYRDVVPDGFLDNPTVNRVIDLLSAGQQFDPAFNLTDGRRVRVLDVAAGDGEVILTCETIAP